MKYFSLFLLFIVVLSAGAAAQTIQLRYVFKPGNSLKFKQTDVTTALAQSNDGHSTQFEKKTTRYITIEIEETENSRIQYRFIQDTAIVEDRDVVAAVRQTDPENILTRRPVRVLITPSGKVESTTPLVPLAVETRLGIPGGDAMFAQRAAIFPVLPTRNLKTGDTWTESIGDTLYPNKELPQIGRGNGVRYITGTTTYTVQEQNSKMGMQCLILRWQSSNLIEEKILFPLLEEFSEDRSTTNGTLYVALDTGLPIHMEIQSEKESTRAVFGQQNTVIPSSVSTTTTLEFIPQ